MGVSDEYRHHSCTTGRRHRPAGQHPFHGTAKGGENMARLSVFTDSEQLSLDDVLADWDDLPPEVTAAVEKGALGPTAGADPDVIMADLELQGDVSQAKIGPETHLDGDCPYVAQCEPRRRKLSTYRQYQKCHWRTWWIWRQCPIFKNGGNGQ